MLNDRTTTASTPPESRSLSRCRSKNFMTFSCAERKFRDELVGDSFLCLAVHGESICMHDEVNSHSYVPSPSLVVVVLENGVNCTVNIIDGQIPVCAKTRTVYPGIYQYRGISGKVVVTLVVGGHNGTGAWRLRGHRQP